MKYFSQKKGRIEGYKIMENFTPTKNEALNICGGKS